MKKYLVISHHTAEDCVRALKEVLASGYLVHFDWGCKDGEHTGWALLEAEERSHAMLSVPPFLRTRARVVQLNKFQADAVEAMHQR